MLRFILAVACLAAMAGCNNEAVARDPLGQAWRASDANGDKPGIGYELRKENGKVLGEAFILDANYPHDFSHGKRAAMTIMEQSPGEITFRVQWNRDLKAVLQFKFNPGDWPDSFPATVAEIIDSSSYDSETYTFSKVK